MLRRNRGMTLIQAVPYAVSRDTVARGAISARITATRAGVSAITAVRRIWLAGLTKPILHRAPYNGLVADVFIRFVAAPRAYTPAYAAGPYDATDAITPARIRDSYRLELLQRTEVDQLEANLPRDRWADLGAIADLDARRLELQKRILGGWKGGTDQWDSRGPVPLPEHVEAQDPTALFLARLIIPATISADNRVIRKGDVSVRNDLRQFVYSTAALAAWSGMRTNPA